MAVLTTPGHEGKIYNITGPDLQTFDEVAAILTEVTGVPVAHVKLDDEGQYAMFDAMGIPRRPVDDQSVNGIPWNSDDMVTFGQAIREGYLALVSDDVERLTGRKARSVRKMIEDNKRHAGRGGQGRPAARMNRADYDRYLAAFNAKDYDAVCDFYAHPMGMDFSASSIRSREDMKRFYGFLHAHVHESVSVLNFASSDTLTAVDAIVRIEAYRDLTPGDAGGQWLRWPFSDHGRRGAGAAPVHLLHDHRRQDRQGRMRDAAARRLKISEKLCPKRHPALFWGGTGCRGAGLESGP